MSRTTSRERLEELEDVMAELREVNATIPIVVEGDKDEAALRNLGLTGRILHVHSGTTIFHLCEAISWEFQEVVLLLDWDRTGGRLTRRLRDGLAANGVRVNLDFRRDLARASRKDLSDVESLDTYLHNLRANVGPSPFGSSRGARKV